jgi:hypothetical protein
VEWLSDGALDRSGSNAEAWWIRAAMTWSHKDRGRDGSESRRHRGMVGRSDGGDAEAWRVGVVVGQKRQ